MTFPVSIKDMVKIERQHNININVSGFKGETYTIRSSKENYEDTLNVLLIEGEEPDQKHYVLIKDVNRFNFNISKHESKKYFCMHCLQYFHTEYHLEKHKEDCLIINDTQKIEMSTPGSKVYFKNHQKQLAGPFAIYADLEAITKKIDTCSPRGDKSYTQAYQKHEPSGFGYKVVCHYDQKYSKPAVIYRGENVIEKFIQHLFEEVKDCQKVISENAKKRLVMTASDEEDFRMAEKCWICDRNYIGEKTEEEKDIVKDEECYWIGGDWYKPEEKEKTEKERIANEPVRDHCHITGKYRGSAHRKCNLKLQISAEKIKIPVIIHNLIIEKLGDIIKEKDLKGEEPLNVNVIATNAEKYMAIYLDKHLAFINSLQFMSSSLANLAKHLPDNKYIHTSEAFQGEKLALTKAKGVYPYDYMDAEEKFLEKRLPNKEDFYSILTDEDTSDEEYQHAQKVWDTFGIENMCQYHDLYLKSDVLLLADIFENFRETCLTNYGLDPCHYTPHQDYLGMLC